MTQGTAERTIDAIANVAKVLINSTRTDETIDAEIVSLANVDTGEYKVSYENSVFSAFSDSSLSTYRVGERVYVLVPQGDFTLKKIILGRSAYQNNMTYADAQTQTNFFIDSGPNWLEAWYHSVKEERNEEGELISSEVLVPREQIEITSYSPIPQEGEDWKLEDSTQFTDIAFIRTDPGIKEHRTQATQYPEHYLTEEELTRADEELQVYAEEAEYIKIQADFQSLFNRLPRAKGQYMVRVTCLGDNPNYVDPDSIQSGIEEDEEHKEEPLTANYVFELGFPDFTGAPYSYVTPNTQVAYFPIVPGTIKGLYSVELTQDGNLDLDCLPVIVNGETTYPEDSANLSEPNIFANAIDISFAKQINLTETLYTAIIETPQGQEVYDAPETGGVGRASVSLVARLLYGGRDILDESNCEVYWFRQDPRRTVADVVEADRNVHNKTWYDYAGPGWMPIDSTVNGRSIEDSEYYNVDFNVLTVRREAVKWQWLYKVVIVYYGTTGDQGLNDPELNVVTQVAATQVVMNASSPYDLKMQQINDNTQIHLEVINLNDMQVADATVPLDQREPNEDWFATWYLMLQDTSYSRISNDRGVVRGPFRVDNLLGNHYGHFYAVAFDPYQVNRNGEQIDDKYYRQYQEDPIGVVDIELTTPNANEIEWYWTGTRNFNYDALGNIKLQDHLVAHTIAPQVHFATGTATGFQLIIYGPDNTVVTTYPTQIATDPTKSDQLYNPPNSLVKSVYLDGAGNGVVHFKIADKYDPEKALPQNNTFTAVLKRGTKELSRSTCTITFGKDGDQGSIGNEWSARIAPCNAYYGEGDKVEQFLYEYGLPCPLVLYKDEYGRWQQNERFRVFLRPFVMRNGVFLENEDPYEAYFFRTYWDVRMPASASAEEARYASFLRLYHTDGVDINAPVEPENLPIFTRASSSDYSMYQQGDTLMWANKVNDNEGKVDGLVGFTQWPANQAFSSELPVSAQETYGSVEVRFFDNERSGTGASLATMQYRFIVKAQIDILKGSYDNRDDKWHINTDGDVENIATINYQYPVDVIFDPDNKLSGLDQDAALAFLRSIKTNWPTQIRYNPTGYEPEAINDYLYFTYTDPTTKEETSYAAWNAAPLVATLKTTWSEEEGLLQKYCPKPHLNMTEGMHGVLTTTINLGENVTYDASSTTEVTSGVPDQIFGNGFYLRNQVIFLNQYGNVDINGWDGQGIDMNEDRGTIFSTTMGAGYKSPQTNLFTGVLMGADASQPRSATDTRFGSFTEEDVQKRPYLTGLFGYQDGVQSFGLMENGTAFFGRADGGGRIIIDGNNATIYGGANGQLNNATSITDPMWNCMRLSFVDFTHATSKEVGAITGYEHPGLSDKQVRALMEIDVTVDPDDVYKNGGNPDKNYYNEWQILFSDDGKSGKGCPVFINPNEGDPIEVARVTAQKELNSDPRRPKYPKYRYAYDADIAEEYRGTEYEGKKVQRWFLNIVATTYGEEYGPVYVPIKSQKTSYLVDDDGNIVTVEVTNSKGQVEKIPVTLSSQGFMNQGFDGQYYGYNRDREKSVADMLKQLPTWYAKVWENAYIKKPNALPYWYRIGQDPARPYESLPWYNYELETASNDDKIVDDNWRINYFSDIRLFEGQNQFGETVDKDGNVVQRSKSPFAGLSGFGPSRASTTPAIEIGQHPTGLMPGLLDWNDYEEVFETLAIPGNRNFLVTYDGTLWAMNGIFMGTVIGSNIIGGRIQGAELGIGNITNDRRFYYRMEDWERNRKCYPDQLKPPIEVKAKVIENGAPNVSFYVDTNGEVIANRLSLYGGRIDIGHFHIFGEDPDDEDDPTSYGHLLQVSESDFVGETHFYGNALVAPTLAPFGGDSIGDMNEWNRGSSEGNLAQVYGTVALGIPIVKIPENAEETGYETPDDTHSLSIWAKYYNKIFKGRSGSSKYMWNKRRSGDDLNTLPPIGSSNEEDVTTESSAMFGICSSGSLIPSADYEEVREKDKGEFMGHFWPLHYHFGWSEKVPENKETGEKAFIPVNAYVTTMNLFEGRSFAVRSNLDPARNTDLLTSNYFRIGPYGSEGQRHWFRANFQSEDKSEQPKSDNKEANYLGWVGLVNRKGDPYGPPYQVHAIGMQSWYSAPIIIKSDGEGAFDARGHFRLQASGHGGNWSYNGETWKDAEAYGTAIIMGETLGNQQDNAATLNILDSVKRNRLHLLTAGGPIKLGIAIPEEIQYSEEVAAAQGFKDYALQSAYMDPSPLTWDFNRNNFQFPMGITIDPIGTYTGGVFGNHGDMTNPFLLIDDPWSAGNTAGGGVPGVMMWGSEEAEVHIFRRPPASRCPDKTTWDNQQYKDSGHEDGAMTDISELWLGTTFFDRDIDPGAKEIALLSAKDGVFLAMHNGVHGIYDATDKTKIIPRISITDKQATIQHPENITISIDGGVTYIQLTKGEDGKGGIAFSENIMPENQNGIYARFA